MRRRIWLFPVAALVGFLTLCGFRAAFAGGFHHHPWRMTRMVNAHVDDLLDDLKATDAQRKQTHVLVDGLLKDGEALRDGHEQAREDILAQWNQPKPDAAKVHALVDTRFDSFKAFAHKVVDAGLQFHDLLTPDQRTEVSQRVEAHHH